MKKVVAIVGATGAVGREMLATLEQRNFPLSELKLFASKRSAGERVTFRGAELVVKELSAESFSGVDIALFSAGAAVSREYAPVASEEGAIVIDNSSEFRMHQEVPLIVPEVNASHLREFLQERERRGAIIANPNCSTIQLVVVLHPIEQAVGLRRVVVSTYQSVSGAGKKGMDELWEQTRSVFSGEEKVPKTFPHPIAFNCLPQIDIFLEGGYTKEELKIVNESRKILSLPELRITATCVRVPVFSCHSESVNIETKAPFSAEQARELLLQSPGIVIEDDPQSQRYPLGREVVDTDATYVGRIRDDHSLENGLNMWIVADNLRKGAALNAVQIAEIVSEDSGQTR